MQIIKLIKKAVIVMSFFIVFSSYCVNTEENLRKKVLRDVFIRKQHQEGQYRESEKDQLFRAEQLRLKVDQMIEDICKKP